MAPNNQSIPSSAYTGSPEETEHLASQPKTSHRHQINKVRRMLTRARKRGAASIVTRYTRRGIPVY